MDNVTLAYLAGAIDSDGSIGIRRSTYARRVQKDASNPVFSERIVLKQVTPQIPTLLHEAFAGYLRLEKPSCVENGRPLWAWQTTDRNAARAAKLLLPFLRVKRRQAELLLELRRSKGGQFRKLAYWFALESPGWQKGPLMTTSEVVALLGYSDRSCVTQALGNGSLLAIPYDKRGVEKPRFPRAMVELFASRGRNGKTRPPELIAWRERLFAEIKGLNQIGRNGTAVNRREGAHTPTPG